MMRFKLFGAVTALAVVAGLAASFAPASPVQAAEADKVLAARQGLMQIVVREAGPLFGMAKGEIAYDAGMAQDRATSLAAIAGYDFDRLFPEGTAKPDLTGKTRALPAIWEDRDGFRAAYQEMQEAAAALAADAGKGKDAMTAAVQALGKSCGNCHEDYRAEDF
jgi:cytochrome c556